MKKLKLICLLFLSIIFNSCADLETDIRDTIIGNYAVTSTLNIKGSGVSLIGSPSFVLKVTKASEDDKLLIEQQNGFIYKVTIASNKSFVGKHTNNYNLGSNNNLEFNFTTIGNFSSNSVEFTQTGLGNSGTYKMDAKGYK